MRYKAGDYDGAISDYNKALEQAQPTSSALFRRGIAKLSKKDYDGLAIRAGDANQAKVEIARFHAGLRSRSIERTEFFGVRMGCLVGVRVEREQLLRGCVPSIDCAPASHVIVPLPMAEIDRWSS